jgi:hypothetical protein
MFVYYYVTLELPFAAAEYRLISGAGRLGELAGIAYREGEEIRARIGLGGEKPLIAKTVRLEIGEPRRGHGSSTFPVVWEATGPRVLFPRMEGDLVVASIGPDLTQLVFRGSYRPPLGPIGRAIDRSVLHRVAEASVKGFVDRIGHAIAVEPIVIANGGGRVS